MTKYVTITKPTLFNLDTGQRMLVELFKWPSNDWSDKGSNGILEKVSTVFQLRRLTLYWAYI